MMAQPPGDERYWLCLWFVILIIRFLTALGAVFSIPKCHFRPQQVGPWLGFEIDTNRQQFRVSEAKLQKTQEALREFLLASEVSSRLLAKLAGKIISLSPAVVPAALYSRPLFEALSGKLSWDEIFETPAAAREVAKLFQDTLTARNGRRWFPRQVTLEVGYDASEFGFGGTLRALGGRTTTFLGSLTETEVLMSSTAREVLTFLRVLEEASTKYERLLQGGSVLLRGDNQGAVASVNQFRSRAPDVNRLMKEIFALCTEKDFDVVAQWRPREEMQLEDDLNKLPDSSDWGLRQTDRDAVLREFRVRPAIDLFASDVWHATSRFVSQHATPGAYAVDAMRQDWTELVMA
jgi:hypothetical protein